MRTLCIIIIACLLSHTGSASVLYSYDYNQNCTRAYQLYMSLQPRAAETIISTEKKVNPRNLMAVYLADYDDCLELLINSDPAEYERRRSNFDTRLEQLRKGDKNSPWYRLCIAGVYLHKAIINVRFGEQYKAALNFRHSCSLLKENAAQFPGFEYNYIFSGLQQAVVGSLPPGYKWLASVFGMKGDVRQGTAALASFVNTHNESHPLYAETVLYYLYARFYLLSEQQEVWNFVNTTQFDATHNLLNTFVKANIALDYHKADEAIATLRAASAAVHYNLYPVFHYQMGVALLTRGDTACAGYFMQYLQTSKSPFYIKDTWQKMAFSWYICNDMAKANYCLSRLKASGTATIDADKQAARFAEKNTWPLRPLLKARLLIDGGYSGTALATLARITPAELTHPADKAEYYFRLGRANEDLAISPGQTQHYKIALGYYRQAMDIGKGRPEQFAARAALHMGKIFELLHLDDEAIKKYNECLDLPPHDFQNSIDQQAKAGINRVEGR